MSKYKIEIDGSNLDVRIPIEEVHKMFTLKQLWDSYVEKHQAYDDLLKEAEAMAEALEYYQTQYSNDYGYDALVANEALARFKKFKV